MDIGADLRKARIARKRSIEEISRATKITTTVLQAIENDAFASVPGGLFTRGYLRAYAREVGLDGESLVARYRAEFETPEPPPEERAQPAEVEREWLGWIRPLVEPEEEGSSRTKTVLIELCIVLVAVTIYFVGWKRPSVRTAELKPNTALAVSPTDAATPAVQPAVATTGRSEIPRTPTLEIHTSGDCWVEATLNGERVIARLMKSDETQSLPIRGEIRIRVGDPGAFAFSVDGVAGRPVGHPGQPATMRLNTKNYRELLEAGAQ
jgi:cytoskeletal protein RodZ